MSDEHDELTTDPGADTAHTADDANTPDTTDTGDDEIAERTSDVGRGGLQQRDGDRGVVLTHKSGRRGSTKPAANDNHASPALGAGGEGGGQTGGQDGAAADHLAARLIDLLCKPYLILGETVTIGCTHDVGTPCQGDPVLDVCEGTVAPSACTSVTAATRR